MNENYIVGRKLYEKLNINLNKVVSIIGGCIREDEYKKHKQKYNAFLNHLEKYIRSSNDRCLISGDCIAPKEDTINLSELIGRKLHDYPYYDSKNNAKIRLIGIGSTSDEHEEINLFSNKYDNWNECYEADELLAKHHTDYIFAKDEQDAKSFRLEFENEFDHVTYILININTKEQLEYIDKIIFKRRSYRYNILFVTVS